MLVEPFQPALCEREARHIHEIGACLITDCRPRPWQLNLTGKHDLFGPGSRALRVRFGCTCQPGDRALMVRFEHYGWCKGTITGKVVDRRRTINKEAINFIAEFDIDDGASTDLSLDVSEYDPSPSADYQSWLLLQEAAG